MRTKIVYVVVSNDNDVYLEQALLSVYSAKFYNPNTEIILLVDNFTNATIKGKRAKILDYISSKVVVEIKGKYTNQQRSRILKTSVREYIEGDFLFIDSDTIITSSLMEIDSFGSDIGAVKDFHLSLEKNPGLYHFIRKIAKIMKWPIYQESNYFNSGVTYVKDNLKTRQFYKDWNRYWCKGVSKGINIDQPAFAMSNILNNHIIHELSGEWNCQLRHGLRYLENVKIFHYWSADIYNKPEQPIAEFMNKRLYLKIKKDGDIDNEMIHIIENPKNYFAETTDILSGKDVYIWNSASNILLRYIYNYSRFFQCVNFFSRCILFFNRHIIRIFLIS